MRWSCRGRPTCGRPVGFRKVSNLWFRAWTRRWWDAGRPHPRRCRRRLCLRLIVGRGAWASFPLRCSCTWSSYGWSWSYAGSVPVSGQGGVCAGACRTCRGRPSGSDWCPEHIKHFLGTYAGASARMSLTAWTNGPLLETTAWTLCLAWSVIAFSCLPKQPTQQSDRQGRVVELKAVWQK